MSCLKIKETDQGYIFAGYNISSTYLKNLLDILDGQDISINVISKSGTTMETTLAFTVLRDTWRINTAKTRLPEGYMQPWIKGGCL